MTFGDLTGWFAVGFIALCVGLSWPWAGVALFAGVVAAIWAAKACQRRSERRRLAHEADYQHAAIMQGHDHTGIYGHYQPVPGTMPPVIQSSWPQ